MAGYSGEYENEQEGQDDAEFFYRTGKHLFNDRRTAQSDWTASKPKNAKTSEKTAKIPFKPTRQRKGKS